MRELLHQRMRAYNFCFYVAHFPAVARSAREVAQMVTKVTPALFEPLPENDVPHADIGVGGVPRRDCRGRVAVESRGGCAFRTAATVRRYRCMPFLDGQGV
jgi:hypothetical protein